MGLDSTKLAKFKTDKDKSKSDLLKARKKLDDARIAVRDEYRKASKNGNPPDVSKLLEDMKAAELAFDTALHGMHVLAQSFKVIATESIQTTSGAGASKK